VTPDALFLIVVAVELLIPLGLLAALPFARRHGLVFGVHVGDRAPPQAVAALDRRWRFGLAIAAVTGFATAYGLRSIAGPLVAHLTVTWGGIAVAIGLYLHLHRRAKAWEAPPSGWSAAGTVEGARVWTWTGPVTMAFSLAASLGMAIAALRVYDRLPEEIPVHFGLDGTPDRWESKSLLSLLMLPLLSGFLGIYLGIFAHLMAQAKRWIRRGADAAARRAQVAFQNATVGYLCILAAANVFLFGAIQRDVLRTALDGRGRLSPLFWIAFATLLFVSFGGIVFLLLRFGQAGARRERSHGDLPDELANDRFWRWGSIYANPDDSALMVEKRFGIGYTLNFGNPRAVWLLVGFVGGLAGITVLAGLV